MTRFNDFNGHEFDRTNMVLYGKGGMSTSSGASIGISWSNLVEMIPIPDNGKMDLAHHGAMSFRFFLTHGHFGHLDHLDTIHAIYDGHDGTEIVRPFGWPVWIENGKAYLLLPKGSVA